MKVKRTGLVTDSRARSIRGWFGSGLVIIRKREIVIRENTCHKIKPLFGWYLCKFRGYTKIDCSFYGRKFTGYSKQLKRGLK